MATMCIVRGFIGLAQAFMITAVNSMIIINYSDRSDDILGLASVCNALGVVAGPVVGAILFYYW